AHTRPCKKTSSGACHECVSRRPASGQATAREIRYASPHRVWTIGKRKNAAPRKTLTAKAIIKAARFRPPGARDDETACFAPPRRAGEPNSHHHSAAIQ